MPSQNWARITIALAAIVSAVMVLVTGGSGAVSLNTAKIVISASSIVTILLLAFDGFLWRWPGVRRLHKRPVLRGTWKTELRTTYEERKDEVIDCFLVIDQTFSRICARMLFDRSRSNSMSGDIVRENGRCVLYYIFRSDKNALAPDTNPPARGAADLTIASTPKATTGWRGAPRAPCARSATARPSSTRSQPRRRPTTRREAPLSQRWWRCEPHGEVVRRVLHPAERGS
jgi:SMODS-associating 2TM, beta-strand rich effector domain